MSGRLCIDIGNSTIKAAFKQDESLAYERIDTDLGLDFEDIRGLIKKVTGGQRTEGAIISSVVKELTDRFVAATEAEDIHRVIVLDHRVDTGLKISIKSPELLGPDRIANAVAAYELYRENVMVVDFGTATTTTVVTEKAELIGGHIMPGVESMLSCLSERTSRLPALKPFRPQQPFGNDTKSSIMSGVIYGTSGAVRRFMEEIKGQIGNCSVVLTGGMAELVKDYLDFPYTHVPMLTLKGLLSILDRSLS